MRSLLVILILTHLFIFAPSAQAAIVDIHVYSAADSGTSTLRQAILDGNALVGDAPRILIHLDYTETIALQSPLPTLTAPVFYIEGAGYKAKITGQNQYHILEVDASVLFFRLENVRLENGSSTGDLAACLDIAGDTGYATIDRVWMENCIHHSTDGWAAGGAMKAQRNLTIRDSVFLDNKTTGTSDVVGGAVALLGNNDLVIDNSYFGFNDAIARDTGSARGGAVWVDFGSSLAIHDSKFVNNRALTPSNTSPMAALGGALYAKLTGAAEIERTEFKYNDANTGGAIYHYAIKGNATLSLRNCSIYGNFASAGSGGALFGNGTLSLRSNTFWKNSASVAGDNLATDTPGLDIDSAYNNLFTAGEGAGDSCHGFDAALNSDYNIVPAVECGMGMGNGDQVTTEPHIRGVRLLGLGGVELYANSPALDAGNPIAPDDSDFSACPETDMLGQPRPVDASATGAPARCDIGALEAQTEPSLFIDDFDGGWLRP